MFDLHRVGRACFTIQHIYGCGLVLIHVFQNKNTQKLLLQISSTVILDRLNFTYRGIFYLKQISKYCNVTNAKTSDFWVLIHPFLLWDTASGTRPKWFPMFDLHQTVSSNILRHAQTAVYSALPLLPSVKKTTNQKPLRLFIQLRRTFRLSQKPNTRQDLSGNTRKTLRGLTFLYSIKNCSFIQPPHVVCATDDGLNESDLSRNKIIFNSPLLVVLSRKAYSILIHQVNNSTV